MDIGHFTGVAANVASSAAILAAGAWFIYTTKFKQRIQFDCQCGFIPLPGNHQHMLAELRLILENKGFVEHRIWNLNVSVHALGNESELSAKPETHEVLFDRALLPRTQIVPKKTGYWFVRPGVRQTITHVIMIPGDVSTIRVTAGFDYKRSRKPPRTNDTKVPQTSNSKYPHTIRRVFRVGARD